MLKCSVEFLYFTVPNVIYGVNIYYSMSNILASRKKLYRIRNAYKNPSKFQKCYQFIFFIFHFSFPKLTNMMQKVFKDPSLFSNRLVLSVCALYMQRNLENIKFCSTSKSKVVIKFKVLERSVETHRKVNT